MPVGGGRKLRYVTFLFCLWIGTQGAVASDLLREQRIADEISEMILLGEPIQLAAGELEFLAIHAEAETDNLQGGAIILHGMDAHPDWNDVVQPLRSQLPEFGWETHSLQLPVAAGDAPEGVYGLLVPEAFPRIDAGVEFFKQRGIVNIALIGHSLGARMGVEYLAAGTPKEIRAFVGVGLPAARNSPAGGTLAALEKITIPLLDIYGDRDIGPVLDSVRARAMATRKGGNSGYRQIEVPGADHFFNGLADTLVARVRAWLKKVAPVDTYE